MATRWRLGYRPALDGLRGVAVLLVIAAHLEVGGFELGGIVGVSLFFVLSGFLITALLLEELRATGRVDLRRFYLRRVLRLVPALVVLVLVASIWDALTGRAHVMANAVAALTYTGDFVRAAGGTLGSLSHTWSLAIEEQFYLAWPIALLALWRRPRLAAVLLAGGAVAVAVRRAAMDAPSWRLEFAPDTRADAILLGCSLAFVATTWGRPWAGPRPWRFLEASPLVLAGRVSYGLYLWHVPIDWAVDAQFRGAPWALRVVLTVALTGLATGASWVMVERPFLRLKDRLWRPEPLPAGLILATT